MSTRSISEALRAVRDDLNIRCEGGIVSRSARSLSFDVCKMVLEALAAEGEEAEAVSERWTCEVCGKEHDLLGGMMSCLREHRVELERQLAAEKERADREAQRAYRWEQAEKRACRQRDEALAREAQLRAVVELLVSAAKGVPHNGDNLVMGTLEAAIEEAESALRAPGGGELG